MGRPLKEFTDEQVSEMENLAFEGCQNNTIATIIGIPIETLTRRFGNNFTKKRAERKLWLRRCQNKACEAGDRTLLIFLGKNELDQKDAKDLNVGGQKDNPIEIVMFGKPKKG